ncbi:MAG: DUF2059 domain-containing protein [Brevundimonas sp.]
MLAAPVAAQDADNEARRLALAGDYLELTQGENLRKTITTYFEESFADSDLPADQRDWLTQQMGIAFDQAMQRTFADITDDVAEIFTVAELEAMIAFFDTPMGRSITEKSFDFGVRLEAAMTPHLTTAFTQLGEKYCARFDCPAETGGAAKFQP